MKLTLRFHILILLFLHQTVKSQDPHFTQAFSSPLLINPAYTGVFNNSLSRLSVSHRQQWSSFGSPFLTSYFAFDTKVFDDGLNIQNPFNVGFQFISDKTLKGAIKNNSSTLSLSYHVRLANNGKHTIGLGTSFGYGNQKFDLSNLSTGSQFASGGFNLSLPSGESLLENIKPYFIVSPGILYTYNNNEDLTYFDFGISLYNINRTNYYTGFDASSRILKRFSAQVKFQKYINDLFIFNTELLYQSQYSVEYLLAGISFSRLLNDEPDASMIGLGIFYRTDDMIAPTIFAEFNKIKIGFSSDIQINGIRSSLLPASSSELSIVFRFNNSKISK